MEKLKDIIFKLYEDYKINKFKICEDIFTTKNFNHVCSLAEIIREKQADIELDIILSRSNDDCNLIVKLSSSITKISDDVLVFTKFSKIELFGIKDFSNSEKLFDLFMNNYNNLHEEALNHNCLYLVINKNIEVTNIVYLDKNYLPCVNSSIIRITLKHNQRKGHFKRIMRYIENIPDSTKVCLNITFSSWNNSLFEEAIMKVIQGTKIVQLNIKNYADSQDLMIHDLKILYKMFGIEVKTSDNGNTILTECDFPLKHLKDFYRHSDGATKDFLFRNMNETKRNYLREIIKTLNKIEMKLKVEHDILDFIKFI